MRRESERERECVNDRELEAAAEEEKEIIKRKEKKKEKKYLTF